MKLKSLLALALCAVVMSFSPVEQAVRYGQIDAEHGGKLVYVKTVPTGAYEVVGKAKAKISGTIDASGLYDVGAVVTKLVEKEKKGKQDPFDAFIVHKPSKIELIKFLDQNDEKNYVVLPVVKDYKKKCGAKDIYLMSKPLEKYTQVGEITPQNFTGIGQMKMGKDEIDDFLNKIYERACKESKDGVEFDAIVIYASDALVTGGLFSKQSAQLIKYN